MGAAILGIFLALSSLLGAGCSREKSVEKHYRPYVAPPADRLVLTRLREEQQRTPATRTLTPGPDWGAGNAADFGLSERGAYAKSARPPLVIRVPVDLDARDATSLRLRMQVTRGSTCVLRWTTDIDPHAANHPGHSLRIISGPEVRDYEIPVDSYHAPTWQGRVNALLLSFPDEASEVLVKAVEVVYAPPEGPSRITIDGETREALSGSQSPWVLTLPNRPSFEVSLGFAERSWSTLSAGKVRFRVRLTTEKGADAILLNQEVDPVAREEDRIWIRRRIDLDAFAGHRVTLHLEIDPLEDAVGDYAYWGNPIVYSREVIEEVTPVILISCDTARADHFSVYGYERQTTPNLEAWSREAVVFENATTEEAWTLPAHMTMLTGQHPKRHRATSGMNLAERSQTMAEHLQGAGYFTGGFAANRGWLQPWRGFAHGFDRYSLAHRDIFETNKLAFAWMEGHGQPNLFLFLQNMDLHSKIVTEEYRLPYGPSNMDALYFAKVLGPPPANLLQQRVGLGARDLLDDIESKKIKVGLFEHNYMRALYDDALRFVDTGIQEVFDTLKGRGLYDQALIIVTADHGEELYDRARYGHSTVYEENAHVPLMIRFPYGRHGGQRIRDLVQLADLYPTILDVLGLEEPQDLDGRSLLPLVNGDEGPHKYAFSQRIGMDSVRNERWKLIRFRYAGERKLFDLQNDPGETEDVSEQHAHIVAELNEEIADFMSQESGGWHISYDPSEDKTPVHLTLHAAEGFERSNLIFGVRTDRGAKLTHMPTMLKLEWGAITHDELIAEPSSRESPVFLTVSSEKKVRIILGAQPLELPKSGQIRLDPREPTLRDIQNMKIARDERATIRIWYVPSEDGQTSARPMSPEEKEQLESLGYVQN